MLLLYPLIQLAILVLPVAVLIGPLMGLPRRSFWWALALQLVAMGAWALFGGAVIGEMLWQRGGGCAGHGGGFEGRCGYAGVAETVMTGYATAVIMTLACGIVLRLLIKKRSEP